MPATSARCEPDLTQGRLRIEDDARAIVESDLQDRPLAGAINIKPAGIQCQFNRRENPVDRGQKAGLIRKKAHGILDRCSVAYA